MIASVFEGTTGFCMWCRAPFILRPDKPRDQSWYCDPCLELERVRNIERAKTGETPTRRWLCDFDPMSLSKIGQEGFYHFNTGQHCSEWRRPERCSGLVQWIVPGVWKEGCLKAFGAYILLCDGHNHYWMNPPRRMDHSDFVGPLDAERSWPPEGRLHP